MGQAIGKDNSVILVVDDEAIIRHELVDTLEENGFTVLDAANADEAIEVMEAHPEIAAVVTDVHMPGSMDGIRLVHYIRNRWPPAALFVVSAQTLAADRALPEQARFYGKPLDNQALVKDLNAALAR